MYSVILDGVEYPLRVKHGTIGRSFRIEEGQNAGHMLSGRYERDITGTYFDYVMSVEPDPVHPEIYDQFYEAISAPVDSHKLVLPYGQSTIAYNAMVTYGNDKYRGKIAGVNRWGGLEVCFTAMSPYRRP